MSESIAELRGRLEADPSNVQTFEAYERALVQNHDVQALHDLYERAEDALSEQIPHYWMRLLRHVDQAVSRAEDDESRGRLYLMIGKIYEEHLGRPDQANASYQQAYRVCPRLSEALDRARAIYTAAGNWDLVLRLWEMQSRNDRSEDAQADIFTAMGRVCLDQIGDGARATDFARRALTQVPGHEGAQKILDDYADLTRDWQGEISVELSDARELSDTAARVEKIQELLSFVIDRVPLGKVDAGAIVEELTALDEQNIRSWVLARTWFDREENLEAAEAAHRPLTTLLEGDARIDALREAATRANAVERVDEEIHARRALLKACPDEQEHLTTLESLTEDDVFASTRLDIYVDAIEAGAGDRVEVLRKAAHLARDIDRPDQAQKHFEALREEAPDALDALEFLHERALARDDAEAQYDLLIHWAPLLQKDAQAERWSDAATLADTRLDQPSAAIEAWNRRLELLPNDLDARRALRSLYTRVEAWDALAKHLEGERVANEPIDDKDAIVDELIELYTTHLEQYADALVHLHQRVNASLHDEALGVRLRDVARRADAIDDVRKDLRMRIDAAEQDARFAYVDELARLELEADHKDAARPWLDELMDHDKTGIDLLRIRRDIAHEEKDVDRLIELQRRIADRLKDEEGGSEEYVQLAKYAEEANAHDVALEAFRGVLAREGETHADARQGVSRSLQALERWDALADSLDIELKHAPTAETHARLAELAETHLDDLERAVRHRNEAIERDPSDQRSAKVLIEYYAQHQAWEDIERVAVHSDLQEEGWDRAFEAWQAIAAAVEPALYPASDLPKVHQQLKTWAETGLNDLSKRYDICVAHAAHKNDEQAWVSAADCAKAIEREVHEYDAIVNAAAQATSAEGAVKHWTRAAVLAEQSDEISSDGWQERANAWEAAPADGDLRDAFTKSSIATERIDAYAAALDSKLDLVEGEPRTRMLRDLGVLYAGPLADEARSIHYWKRLLEEKQNDSDALNALHTLYTADSHAEELLEIVETMLEHQSDADREALERQRADLLDHYLEQPDRALEAWKAVQKHGGEHALHAVERIEALFRQTERFEDLETFFSEQLGTADSPEHAAMALVRRGVLRVNDTHNVAEGVQDLLNVVGGFSNTNAAEKADGALREHVGGENETVVDTLVDWHDANERQSVGDDLLEVRIEAHGEQDAERWRRLIGRLKERTGQEHRLIAHWVGYQLAHTDTRDEALEMMDWSRENDQSGTLVSAWGKRLMQVDTPPIWWTDYLTLAVETGVDTDNVLRVLQRLRELDETQSEAIGDAIEELLASVGRFQDQIDVIQERAATSDVADAVSRYVTAGNIAELECKDANQAADIYAKAIAGAPEREDLIDHYIRNLFAAERWAEATEQLRASLERFPASGNKAQWQAQLARAASYAGESDDRVFAALLAASSVTPSAPAVADGLRDLAFREEADPDIARKAATLHLSLGVADSETRRELHERLVELSPDPERRLKSLVALGDLLRQDEEHYRRAWDVHAEALALEPTNATIANRMEKLAAEIGEWRATSEHFAKHAQELQNTDGQTLLERAVRIEVEESDNLERAVRYQEDLLTMGGDSESRLATLQEWYETLQSHEACVRTLDRRAALAQDAANLDHLRDVRLRAVEITDERLQLHEDTVRRWREIVDQHADVRARGLEELSRVHREQSEWSALDAVLSERVEDNSDDAQARHALLREQATLREEELKDIDGAIGSLVRISKEDLENIEVLHELDRLYLRTGDQEARYRIVQERFGRSGNIDDRLELARAGLALEGERDAALQTLCDLIIDRSEVRADALETLSDVADNTPEYLNLERWMLLAQILDDEGNYAAAARANIAVANATETPEVKRARKWISVEQRLRVLEELDAAAEMASELWVEEGGTNEHQHLLKDVVRQAQREELYANAAEKVLNARPKTPELREDLIRWYMEDQPNEERRREHLKVLFEANPKDATIYDDLIAITPEDERAQILLTRLNATPDDDERQRLRASLGLALAQSDDPEDKLQAQRLLEAFRMTQSTNEEVNQTLRTLLSEGGHWTQLASLIEEELWLTDDKDERVRLLVERARCREYEEALPSMMVEGWFDVLAEDASQPDAIIVLTEIAGELDDPFLVARVQDRLELAYEKSARWEELYKLLTKRSEKLEGAERTDALRRAADIAKEKLEDEQRVFETYLHLIQNDPSDTEILEEANAIAQSIDHKERLRSAISQGLQNAQIEPELRTKLRRRAALLKAASPEEKEQAIEELSVLFDARKPWQIVEDVDDLYEDEPEAYIDWLHARADAVDDLDMRIRLLRHASGILGQMSGREEEAGAILESIYLLSPSVEGAEEIDALYQNAGLQKLRAMFWAARLQDETPVLPRIELHDRLHNSFVADEALWAEQIKHLGTWWDALDAAEHDDVLAALRPKNKKAWNAALQDTIARWSQTTDRAEREGDMLDALMKRVGVADGNDALFKARIEVASTDERADLLWEERVRNHSENVSLQHAWKTASIALEDAPERDARGANIERLANELKNYEEAAALLRYVTGDRFDTRYALALRAARIDLEELDLHRRATRTLQSVLDAKPDYAPARNMLREILDRNPRQDLRQRILTILIDTAVEPAEKASLSMIGARSADERHDIIEAKKAATRALGFDPGNTEVRAFLLERRNDTAWHEVLENELLPVLRNEQAVHELQQLIEALSSHERDGMKKAAYAAEVASLLSKSEDGGDGALTAWLQALKSHPHSPSYLENAVNAVSDNAEAILLVDTLETIAEDTEAPEVKAALYASAGHAQLERLGDTDSGVANLLRAIQVNPRNERALDGLETYYLETADYNGLATLLEARLSASEDPALQRDLAARVVTLLRGELNRPNDAAKVLEESLQRTGPDEHLLEELRASYHEAGNVKGEVETLERLAACATDVDERIDQRTEALRLIKDDPALESRALALTEALLLDDQQHPLALTVRESIFRRNGDTTEALNAQFAVVNLHLEDDVALSALQHGLSVEPTDQKKIAQLIARIVSAAVERDLIADVAPKHLVAWLPHLPVAEQRRVIQVILDEASMPGRRTLLVTALRSLRPSSDEALGVRVVEALHQQDALTADENAALAQWFETANQYDRAVEALRRIVENTDDPQKKGETLMQIAKMEEERENFGVLMHIYEEAQSIGYSSSSLYKGLAGGYEREKRWPELVEVLEGQLENAADAEHVRLLRQIASVQRTHLQDEYAAQERLLEAMQIDDTNVQTRLDLIEVYVALQEHDEARALLDALPSETLHRAMRHRVKLAIGRIALQEENWSEAKVALEKAHAHAASHAGTLLALAQTHIALQEWSDAQEALQAALVNQDQLSSEEKATTFVYLARVQAQAGSVERARELVTRALRLEPELQDALALEAELNAVA